MKIKTTLHPEGNPQDELYPNILEDNLPVEVKDKINNAITNVKTINGESIVGTGNLDVTGAQGPTGPQGPQGVQGIQGPQGIQGAVGPQGPKGESGRSFEIVGQVDDLNDLPPATSVSIGSAYYVGTTAPRDIYAVVRYNDVIQWTNQGTLEGPEGPQGPQGPQGVQGIQGKQGEQGPIGPIGPQGPTGNTGPQGPRGATGPQGVPGPTLYQHSLFIQFKENSTLPLTGTIRLQLITPDETPINTPALLSVALVDYYNSWVPVYGYILVTSYRVAYYMIIDNGIKLLVIDSSTTTGLSQISVANDNIRGIRDAVTELS